MCFVNALTHNFLRLETIKENLEKMKNDEEIEPYRKKLEESFSDFYNSKKNVQVSVGFDEKINLKPFDLESFRPKVTAVPKQQQDFRRIQLLDQETSEKGNKSNYLDSFKESYEHMMREQDVYPIAPLSRSSSVFPTFPQIEPAAFAKIDTETLFLVFYFQSNEYERFVASKELKNRGWRFHKKFQMWFKRNKEPKEITPDYETGDILMFDSTESWKVMVLQDFTSEYRLMEENT